jgi:nucleotide-binding universal stress UspA family protein
LQSSRTHTVEKDLHNLGEFILLAAQAEAEEEGVQAEGIVRQGNVGDEIIAVSNELGVNYVVLGSPQGVKDADAFTQDHFSTFVRRVEEDCGAEVVYLMPED